MEQGYDFYVAVTRKGYHFGRTQSLTQDCNPEDQNNIKSFYEKVLRDRDLLKHYNFKEFEGKRILLFDDTAISGETLKNLRNELLEKTNGSAKVDVAAFAISAEILRQHQKYQLFQDCKLYFEYVLNEDDMTKFSLFELCEIHDSMLPYIVDLPIFKKIFLTEEQFKNLIDTANNWSFHDYSFMLQNKMYGNGFFLQEPSILKKIFGDTLLANIVKCRYHNVSDKNGYEVVLTPFVIMKSISYSEMKECFLRLYHDTDYEKIILNSQSPDHDFIGIYRDVVYNLSYFVGTLFEKYIWDRYNIKLSLDLNLTSSSQNEILEKSIYKIFNDFSVDDYLYRLYGCKFTYWRKPVIQISEYGQISFKDVRNYVLGQIAMRKLDEINRANGAGSPPKKYILFEDIEEMMAQKFRFQNERQFQLYFVRIILLCLDCSVMSNDLIMVNGEIKRIFRFGECSEIYFGYDISLFYPAVHAYCNNIGSSAEKYQKNYKSFIKQLYSYLLSNNYLKYDYISDKTFRYFSEYFDLKGNVLDRELRNKRFVLEDRRTENPYIKAVVQFVSNLRFD